MILTMDVDTLEEMRSISAGWGSRLGRAPSGVVRRLWADAQRLGSCQRNPQEHDRRPWDEDQLLATNVH